MRAGRRRTPSTPGPPAAPRPRPGRRGRPCGRPSRRAWADRMAYLGDPDVVAAPLVGLASREYAAARRASISGARATAEIEPGDPWAYQPASQPDRALSGSPAPGDGGCTTHLAVIDRDSNAVA